LEIIEAIEGPIIMNRCLLHERACDRDAACPVHPVWKVMQEKMKTLMLGITLEYLAGNKSNRFPGEATR
jgi:Rrf2 family transcriptional regulator, iron-sulfur cluster assembly transcription factor